MLVILFACGVANAQDSVMVAKKKSGTTCDSCSGDLALAHHFEDATCDDNTKSVCGCSDNASKDLTLGGSAAISNTTGTNWPSDGSYSLLVDTSTETTIPLTWDKTKGTISFDVYCSTYGAAVWGIVNIGSVAGDGIYFSLVTGDNNKVYFESRVNYGTTYTVSSAPTTFTGPKTSVMGKWDTTTAHGSNYMELYINGSLSGTPLTSQPSAINGTYTAIDVVGAASSVCYVDNLKVYTTWQ